VIEKTLARRYAAALLKATEAEGTTETVEQCLRALRDAWNGNKSFRAVLSQPQVSRDRKKALLRKPFEGAGSRAFLEFLGLLVDRNRQNIVAAVAEVYDLLADAVKGEVRVQVRGWKPLTADEKSGLQSALQSIAKNKVLLEEKSDADVLGGVLCYVGHTVVDGTVRHHLKVLGEKLAESIRR
jgi:F-type H+-transporting ATPase subunit delta